MNIRDLKNQIENKSLNDSLLILKYSDNAFIADQYIDAIANFKNKNKVYINNLSDIPDNSDSLFEVEDNNLYILNVEKLENLRESSNIIIKCKTIPEGDLFNKYVVEIPKLKEWQILEYAKTLVPGLSQKEVEWLCEICKYDIYRISSELEKIKIFAKGSQKLIFNLINEDNGYADLSPLTIYNFSNAIIRREFKTIVEVLKDIEFIDIEPVGLVTILRKNIKNIIKIQMNPKATAASLNMPEKQFRAIKYSCGIFNNENLLRIFDMLTSIDIKLKSGELPNNLIIDYILTQMLGG